jgi:multimeric flavodoxin WrbA
MKVIAINASPRKKWNTATLLNKVLEGAKSQGAETEMIHLYDLNYKGCISCFACRVKDGKSYGKCAVNDDLKPVLEKLREADAFVIGSPIYLFDVTGEMRSFVERFLFPYIEYSNTTTIFPRKIPTGLIYTMNAPESVITEMHLDKVLGSSERLLNRFFGDVEILYSTDTYQFDDYSKVVSDRFDVEAKKKRHEEVFPIDCEKAYNMGVEFAKNASENQ